MRRAGHRTINEFGMPRGGRAHPNVLGSARPRAVSSVRRGVPSLTTMHELLEPVAEQASLVQVGLV
jgi:hypothetical protein